MTGPARFIQDTPADGEIIALWRAGKNTNEIAKQLWVDESYIANQLPRLLERNRQDQEWNFDSMQKGTA